MPVMHLRQKSDPFMDDTRMRSKIASAVSTSHRSKTVALQRTWQGRRKSCQCGYSPKCSIYLNSCKWSAPSWTSGWRAIPRILTKFTKCGGFTSLWSAGRPFTQWALESDIDIVVEYAKGKGRIVEDVPENSALPSTKLRYNWCECRRRCRNNTQHPTFRYVASAILGNPGGQVAMMQKVVQRIHIEVDVYQRSSRISLW